MYYTIYQNKDGTCSFLTGTPQKMSEPYLIQKHEMNIDHQLRMMNGQRFHFRIFVVHESELELFGLEKPK